MINKNLEYYKKLAYTDPLTGLSNRRILDDIDLDKCKIFFLDVVDFKSINNELGYNCGDLALITIANHLTKLFDGMEDYYELIRYGGDEFLLIVYDNEWMDNYFKYLLRNICIDFKDRILLLKVNEITKTELNLKC